MTQTQTLTLDNAPLGTRAPSIEGGAWCKVDRGWKWNGPHGHGGTYPRPGGDWDGTLIAPALENQGPEQPQWRTFDVNNPPSECIYWVRVVYPEFDIDADDDGRTVGVATGQELSHVAMARFEGVADLAPEFEAVDQYCLGDIPADSWITHYQPVTVPTAPGQPEPAAGIKAPEAGPTLTDHVRFGGRSDETIIKLASQFRINLDAVETDTELRLARELIAADRAVRAQPQADVIREAHDALYGNSSMVTTNPVTAAAHIGNGMACLLIQFRSDEDAARAQAALKLLSEAVRTQPAAMQGEALTQAERDVLSERRRQVKDEGWTPDHDDEHTERELAEAAAAYLLHDSGVPALHRGAVQGLEHRAMLWPWEPHWWKPKDERSNLVRSAALAVARIEQIDRAQAKEGDQA